MGVFHYIRNQTIIWRVDLAPTSSSFKFYLYNNLKHLGDKGFFQVKASDFLYNSAGYVVPA